MDKRLNFRIFQEIDVLLHANKKKLWQNVFFCACLLVSR